MIPNQWYVILESAEIPAGRPVGVTRLAEKLVLWRDRAGRLACLADQCPHRGVALSLGRCVGDGLQCPFHGFEFDPRGACTLIPANGRTAAVPRGMRARSYPVREAHGLVYLWWGDPRADEDLPALPDFDFMQDGGMSYWTIRDHWPIHYSRVIENQLDTVHLPFVHHNTIGRGRRTVVNGPLAKLSSTPDGIERLDLWVSNASDQGQRALRPSELPPPTTHPMLQFLFPNLWQNWISGEMRILAIFVPVDMENTLLYLRLYQKIVRMPGLRELFNLLGAAGNWFIERQDRRVVISQRPGATAYAMGEKLIPGDSPVILYRKRRDQLKGAGTMNTTPGTEQGVVETGAPAWDAG